MSITTITSISELLEFFGQTHERRSKDISYNICCCLNGDSAPISLKNYQLYNFFISDPTSCYKLTFMSPVFVLITLDLFKIKHLSLDSLDNSESYPKAKLILEIDEELSAKLMRGEN